MVNRKLASNARVGDNNAIEAEKASRLPLVVNSKCFAIAVTLWETSNFG